MTKTAHPHLQHALPLWFQPWDYAHASWLNKLPTLKPHEQVVFYPAYCQHWGIEAFWQTYNYAWLKKHAWQLNHDDLHTALEMLGVMLDRQAKHQLTPSQLRWAYQTGLARPLVLKVEHALQPCQSAFELGLNLLAQLFFCHAQVMWTRFLLRFDQTTIVNSYIYPYPLCTAPMLLIIEKRWQRILTTRAQL